MSFLAPRPCPRCDQLGCGVCCPFIPDDVLAAVENIEAQQAKDPDEPSLVDLPIMDALGVLSDVSEEARQSDDCGHLTLGQMANVAAWALIALAKAKARAGAAS